MSDQEEPQVKKKRTRSSSAPPKRKNYIVSNFMSIDGKRDVAFIFGATDEAEARELLKKEAEICDVDIAEAKIFEIPNHKTVIFTEMYRV